MEMATLRVGDTVRLLDQDFVVRYRGPVDFVDTDETWLGMERVSRDPRDFPGFKSGTVGGRTYFIAESENNSVFLSEGEIEKIMKKEKLPLETFPAEDVDVEELASVANEISEITFRKNAVEALRGEISSLEDVLNSIQDSERYTVWKDEQSSQVAKVSQEISEVKGESRKQMQVLNGKIAKDEESIKRLQQTLDEKLKQLERSRATLQHLQKFKNEYTAKLPKKNIYYFDRKIQKLKEILTRLERKVNVLVEQNSQQREEENSLKGIDADYDNNRIQWLAKVFKDHPRALELRELTKEIKGHSSFDSVDPDLTIKVRITDPAPPGDVMSLIAQHYHSMNRPRIARKVLKASGIPEEAEYSTDFSFLRGLVLLAARVEGRLWDIEDRSHQVADEEEDEFFEYRSEFTERDLNDFYDVEATEIDPDMKEKYGEKDIIRYLAKASFKSIIRLVCFQPRFDRIFATFVVDTVDVYSSLETLISEVIAEYYEVDTSEGGVSEEVLQSISGLFEIVFDRRPDEMSQYNEKFLKRLGDFLSKLSKLAREFRALSMFEELRKEMRQLEKLPDAVDRYSFNVHKHYKGTDLKTEVWKPYKPFAFPVIDKKIVFSTIFSLCSLDSVEFARQLTIYTQRIFYNLKFTDFVPNKLHRDEDGEEIGYDPMLSGMRKYFLFEKKLRTHISNMIKGKDAEKVIRRYFSILEYLNRTRDYNSYKVIGESVVSEISDLDEGSLSEALLSSRDKVSKNLRYLKSNKNHIDKLPYVPVIDNLIEMIHAAPFERHILTGGMLHIGFLSELHEVYRVLRESTSVPYPYQEVYQIQRYFDKDFDEIERENSY